MRNGAMLSVVWLLYTALQLAAQDSQPRASTTATSGDSTSAIQVKVFAIRNGDATSRAEMLRLVLGQGSNGVQPLRIAAELRTNSIVAVGAVGDLEIIRGVLAHLDDPRSPPPQIVRQAQLNAVNKTVPSRIDAQQPPRASSVPTESPQEPVKQEVRDAQSHLKLAKAELERQESLRDRHSTTFSSSELARARLAVRSAEAQLEQLTKPANERPKIGFKP